MNDVLQRILAGDTDAFREVIAAYGPGIRAYFAASLKDPHAVDDLTQETMIATYMGLGQLTDPDHLYAWMRAIAQNKLMLHLRTAYSRKDKVQMLHSEILEQIARYESCEGEEDHDKVKRLRGCIEKLSPDRKELVAARYERCESVTDLAARLNRTVGAVSSLLYHIRTQLRLCMENRSSA